MSGTVTSTRGTEMRDIGPVLKERKKIVKSVGRAEKKAGGLGGVRVCIRWWSGKKLVGGKPEIKIQKYFSLISCSWWKILDTFLCGAFPQNSYCVSCLFLCFYFLFLCFTIHIYVTIQFLLLNNKYKENHQRPWTHK